MVGTQGVPPPAWEKKKGGRGQIQDNLSWFGLGSEEQVDLVCSKDEESIGTEIQIPNFHCDVKFLSQLEG